jgi:hypothetical protein
MRPSRRKVYYSTAHERTTIIYPDDDKSAVTDIRYANLCSEGERANPRAAPRGWGDGPGVLGLTVGGVCETPSVRFLNLGQQLALSLRLWRLRYHRQASHAPKRLIAVR